MALIFLIVVYGFVGSLFLVAPFPIRLLIFIVNLLIPDPIPIIDEVLMAAGLISKLLFVERIADFIENHPVISAILGFIIIMLIVSLFS